MGGDVKLGGGGHWWGGTKFLWGGMRQNFGGGGDSPTVPPKGKPWKVSSNSLIPDT